MDIYVVLWTLLILLVVIFILSMTVRILMREIAKLKLLHQTQLNSLSEVQKNQLYFMERTISSRDTTIQNLLDRLTSPDMHSYRVMTDVTKKMNLTSDNVPAAYVSMSDESEAKRIADMSGIGDTVYDQETLMFAQDMGVLDIQDVINRGH